MALNIWEDPEIQNAFHFHFSSNFDYYATQLFRLRFTLHQTQLTTHQLILHVPQFQK